MPPVTDPGPGIDHWADCLPPAVRAVWPRLGTTNVRYADADLNPIPDPLECDPSRSDRDTPVGASAGGAPGVWPVSLRGERR